MSLNFFFFFAAQNFLSNALRIPTHQRNSKINEVATLYCLPHAHSHPGRLGFSRHSEVFCDRFAREDERGDCVTSASGTACNLFASKFHLNDGPCPKVT